MEVRHEYKLFWYDGLVFLPVVSESGPGRVPPLRNHSVSLRQAENATRSDKLDTCHKGMHK